MCGHCGSSGTGFISAPWIKFSQGRQPPLAMNQRSQQTGISRSHPGYSHPADPSQRASNAVPMLTSCLHGGVRPLDVLTRRADMTRRLSSGTPSLQIRRGFDPSRSSTLRPALERLRDAAAAGAIDRLYIECPDRLARNYGQTRCSLAGLTGTLSCGLCPNFGFHSTITQLSATLSPPVRGRISAHQPTRQAPTRGDGASSAPGRLE